MGLFKGLSVNQMLLIEKNKKNIEDMKKEMKTIKKEMIEMKENMIEMKEDIKYLIPKIPQNRLTDTFTRRIICKKENVTYNAEKGTLECKININEEL